MLRFRYYLNLTLKRLRFFALFKRKGYLGGHTTINNLGRITVGRNVCIGSSVKINVGEVGHLRIGDGVHIGDFCQIEVDSRVSVGNWVTLSDNVFIADVTHTFPVNDRYGHKKKLIVGPVEVREHTWIGRNTVINPGKSIGSYNIVAANSVVAKDMYCKGKLIGGQPAKILGSAL